MLKFSDGSFNANIDANRHRVIMNEVANNNKRIAKNTMYLYFRMVVIMLVQLYTSRVVLANLGFENYGIYSVVASFIIAFTFLRDPLNNATQRFLNYELGRIDKKGRPNLIFNLSLYAYAVLALITFVVLEIAGEWFINYKMNIPDGRLGATQFTFRMSVITLMIGLLKSPFEALIISHERMSYHAYLSVFEALLKLGNAFSLAYFTVDKLELFAFNQIVISMLVFLFASGYCKRNFKDIHITRVWDKGVFVSILNFSGWSLFGAVARMTANQGLTILLNLFFGVVINAAMGVAQQVNAAVNHFVHNFQVAFRPQLVKYYAGEEYDSLKSLICNTSKYSFLLLFAVSCPLMFNVDIVMRLWLNNPPEYAGDFCIFMLIYALLESLSAPMWMAVQATGKIKGYQIVISCAMLLNIILSYIFLRLGYSPHIVLIIKCCADVLYLIVRLTFIKKLIDFNCSQFVRRVAVPVLLIVALAVLIMFFVKNQVPDGWRGLLMSSVIFACIYPFIVYFLGLNKGEKNVVVFFVKNKLFHKK